MMRKITTWFWLWLLTAAAAADKIESVTVSTRAPNNREVQIFYRIPESYNPERRGLYRVMVYFGGRNGSGEALAKSRTFARWADENEIFIVAPTFKDDEYWHPEKWSGRALFEGLALIRKKYRICDDRLLYYGVSGGSQCSNLFPAWRPEKTTAWVSHACGVWHTPSEKMSRVPGLVTCGDADVGRYILSRRFVEESRKKGVSIIWKSFPNTPHEVSPGSVTLAKAFLAYHHRRNRSDLRDGTPVNRSRDRILYVGDDQEGVFWDAGSREIRWIDIEDRVMFPCRDLALAWGEEARRP